ncbi:exonuclease domain-containing protein [Trueperella sp. LYQ141]|uniref:exonuclease domain-containing protein n=1 Tax=Trueperella sp. LYQ141 TaxID=3391058 RepID=UPI0039831AA7
MWVSRPRAGFDTETTGVHIAQDRIVTAAFITSTNGDMHRRTWLANPGIPIPQAAAAVHGISTEQAQRDGRAACEVVAEVAEAVAAHMLAGNPLVVYNATYDLSLLDAELHRYHLPSLTDRLGPSSTWPVIDPYMLDRYVDRFRRGPRKLINLAQHYQLSLDETFHDASGDVIMTLRVLDAMVERYPRLAQMSLADLHAAQRSAYEDFMAFIQRRYPSSEPRGWPIVSPA